MKIKDLKSMGKEEREGRLKELRFELIKSEVNVSKSGSSKIKNIKKTIAQILTLNK